MNNLIIALTCLLSLSITSSNAQNNNAVKTEMNRLAYWVGNWKGEGAVRMGPGEPKKSIVDEHIELKLDGTLLVIEGIGKSIDPISKQETVAHHAFGVVNYDENGKQFKFKTYLVDGKSADAYLIILTENKFEWGFETGMGKVRYTITLNRTENSWNEVGEFSRDAGKTWMNFFEMNLKKQS